MVYKLSHCNDIYSLPKLDKEIEDILHKYISALSCQSEDKENVDEPSGGYLIYATPSTNSEDIKVYFDYSKHIPEYVVCYNTLWVGVYVLNNEFVVIVVVSMDSAPEEILKEID